MRLLPRRASVNRTEVPCSDGLGVFRGGLESGWRARDYRITPRLTAYRTISAALCTSSFSMMRARWVSTVLGLMNRMAAMSLFVLP